MSKFIVGVVAFAKALAQVTPALVNNPVVPILQNVLLEAENSSAGWLLRLTCSDLETVLVKTLADVECREEFRLCVPAKQLLDMLRLLPDQPITCSVDMKAYRFELVANRSRYALAGENAVYFPRQFPSKSAAHRFGLPAEVLRTALASVLPVAHTDFTTASRMCGVHIETNAGEITTLATTDGHRVNQYALTSASPSSGFTVPTKPLGLLLPLLEASGSEPVQLLVDETSIRLADGRWSARLIDERFPEYRNVIPVAQPNVALIDRDELIGALRRLDKVANAVFRAARFDFDANGLRLSTQDVDQNSQGGEQLDCEYAGEELAIGFNCPLVTQQLRLLPPGRVRLTMSTPHRAWIATADVENPPLLCLCMPVQLTAFCL